MRQIRMRKQQWRSPFRPDNELLCILGTEWDPPFRALFVRSKFTMAFTDRGTRFVPEDGTPHDRREEEPVTGHAITSQLFEIFNYTDGALLTT